MELKKLEIDEIKKLEIKEQLKLSELSVGDRIIGSVYIYPEPIKIINYKMTTYSQAERAAYKQVEKNAPFRFGEVWSASKADLKKKEHNYRYVLTVSKIVKGKNTHDSSVREGAMITIHFAETEATLYAKHWVTCLAPYKED